MNRSTVLLVGIAALTLISTSFVSTVAEARDGCGRGWYYNGRGCVPEDGPGYRGDYGPPARYYEPPVAGPPQLWLGLGGRDEPRYSPPNPAFKTWNLNEIRAKGLGPSTRAVLRKPITGSADCWARTASGHA
jgi:hypothetical protein